MQRFLYSLFMAGLLAGGFSAYADSMQSIDGIAKGINPEGTKVVGYKSNYGDAAFSSFLFNVADNNLEWLTNGEDYNGSHLDGGKFTAINNAGIIAGTIRNPDMRLEPYDNGGFKPGLDGKKPATTRNASDEWEGEAISSAAVWRDDKVYVLGCGPYSIDNFFDSTDGSVATGISADGNIVFGNIMSSWMPIEACMWVYNAATDTYEYQRLAVPSNAQISSMIANASEGFPAVGSISVATEMGNMMMPILWLSADEYVALQVPDMAGAYAVHANAVSADGRYVALSVSGKYAHFYVYDVVEKTYKEAVIPVGTTDVSAYTINNAGNCVLKIQDSNWVSTANFFDYASGAVVPMSSYLDDVMPESKPGSKFSGGYFEATTGDGKHLLARTSLYDYSTTWLLNIDNPAVIVASAPSNVEVYHTSPSMVEVKFNGIETLPEGCVLKGYKVYLNGKEVETIEVTEFGGTYYVETSGEVGNSYAATVTTLYAKDGDDKESAMSAAVSAYVSPVQSLLNFYNFDDSYMDANDNIHWEQDTWSARENYGVTGEFINWHFSANDFENRTPAVTTISVATEPWSTVFESHFMDASDTEDFFLDLRYMVRMVNYADQVLDTDYLDVEVTTDGRTWTSVAKVKASDVKPAVWNTLHVDLGSELAGKVFRMRLNAHGEGRGHLSWSVDDIVISDALYGEKPEGLRYALTEDGVKVIWKNAYGMYDVSHLDNSSILWDYNVGNEGKPMIGAIELTDDQLKPFEGEYITAVSTFLYDDAEIEQDAPTTAEAIVYADGEEVARAQFDSEFNTVDQAIAYLDTPVAIEKGKTYRVGVRISGYAAEQAPMYYQAAPTSVPGLTDLYSEDEGKTWHNGSAIAVSDVNPMGCFVWPIRAYISSEEVSAEDPAKVLFYDIFRDGVKINEGNIYEPRTWFEVDGPVGGKYTLQAHYAEGVISPMSEVLDLNGVGAVDQVRFTLGVTTGRGTVSISGDCEGAVLYDMSGRVAATVSGNEISGLSAGVYMLQARTASGYETFKVVVK